MKIKRLLALLLACIFVFNIVPPAVFAENPVFTIAGEDTEAEVGAQAMVNLNMSDNTGFSVLNLYYTYDENYFTLNRVINKAFPLEMTHDKTTVWDASKNYEKDGTLATLVFDVAEDTPYGKYEIGIHLISAANTDLEYVTPVTVNATVTVTPIRVKGVEIINPDVTLDVGATEQLLTKVTPEEAADKSILWKSADNSVATVDENGVVKGVAYGTTEIIATTNDGGFTDRVKVSVNCPHSYSSKVIAPTYLEHGYTIFTCSICGHSYNDNFKDPLDRTPIAEADVSLEYTEAFYEGKPLMPKVYLSYKGEKLDPETELKITYSANNSVGVATVIVEGINRFEGTLSLSFNVSFEVIPAPIVNVSAISDYGKILLSWGRSEEVATDTYRIYRAAEGEEEYTLIKTIVGRDNVNYEDDQVVKGVSYVYYVTGVGAYGAESEPSALVGATALVDVTPPTILKLVPAENMILAGTTTFSAVAEDNVGVLRGVYEYSLDGKTWKKIGTTYDKGLSMKFTVDFDTDVTTLYIRLTVYDKEGNASDPKTSEYVVDNVGPDQVKGLSYEALSSKLTLSWDDVSAADAQYFILQEKTEKGWETIATNITTLGYTVTGLTPDTTYCYRVACVDARENVGIYSEEFYATTSADTTAPVITDQGPASARYNHDFTFYATARDDSDIRRIYIEVSTDLVKWTQIDSKEFDTALSKQEISSIIDLTSYAEGSLFVRAIAEDFAGNLSNTDSSAPFSEYIVDKTAPCAPENVTANGKNGYISIFWTMGKESDIDTYRVYRSLSLDGEYVPVSSSLSAVSFHDTAVESGVVYFYKVAACDRAGNVGAFSEAVSASMSDDTQKPEITGVGTTSNKKISSFVNTISVSAADNNKLSYLLVEYCTSRDLEYKELLKKENIASSYVNAQVVLPVDGLEDGDVLHIRVSAVDMAGLSSGYQMSKFVFDSTAPILSDLAAKVEDNKVTLTWKSEGESDLSGFKVYRSEDGTAFSLLGSRAPASNGEYSFLDTVTAKENTTFIYKVEAVDVLQNAASQTVTAEYVYVYKNTPPTAVIQAPSYMMVDMEEVFDASSSTDDMPVMTYLWDFGDGSTSTEQKAIKKYEKAGTYTVTLTVTDNKGLTSTAKVTMDVKERETLGVLNVAVLDENNKPVPYVPVYFDLGSDNQRIVNTNGSGIATMKLPQGTHLVGMYATGYLPVKKEVVVLQNATRTVSLTTVKEELVSGEFEITRMTFDEIVAAGIDVYDPANRNVYSATVRVFYTSSPPISVNYVRNDSEILDYKIYDYSGKPIEEYKTETGELRHFAGVSYIGGGSGGSGGGSGEETDIIAIIDIPAQASYLKEFFDVKLHIINNASSDFSLEKNTVTLNVPQGMTLMNSVSGGYLTSPVVEIDKIRGQETKTLAWVLRGDTAGEYDLSADFTGTLSLFNAPVNTRFETDSPIKVYGLEGVTFRILTASQIHNETLYFNIELENDRDIDIYAPAAGLTDKVKNVTESVLNQNPEGDFYVQSNVLNVYIANENGAKQYIPFTFDANGNAIVNIDVLAPGQKIVYEYVAYNAIDYDGVGYFKEAVIREFEGLAENIEVGSFEKQRYSFNDYSEKLDAILSGANNETVNAYQHILDRDEYYYIEATGGYFSTRCENLYKTANLVLNLDFSTLTQEDERNVIQAIILTILSDSSVVSQSEDLLMMKYADAISSMMDTIKDGMVKTFRDSESSVKDISDACADILKDKRELAVLYRTEGREAFLAELNKRMAGYAIGITVDVVDYLSPAQEASCFSDVFGDVKDAVGAFFNAVSETEREGYYYAILKKQCDSEISSTILYALRDILLEELQGELMEAIAKNLIPVGSTIYGLQDIGLGANTLAYQIVETMITQLENDLDTFYEDVNLYVNLMGEAGEIAAKKVLQTVFAKAIGSTTFGVISAAFNIADAIFGFGDYVKQQDTFDIYGALSDVFQKAHLNSIQTRGTNADFYSMLYLRALCEMRLSGEAQYKKFMSDYIDGVYFKPIDEEIVLYYVNLVKNTNFTSYDEWGDYLQYSIVHPRDLIFNVENTHVNIPRAPVVSLNYETLKTEQSFTKEYEYCFADGVWTPCDGDPISFTVGSVPSVLRVRRAAGDENLAGEITTVKIFAQKELSKLIGVKFDGVNYLLENLSSDYHYQILFTDQADEVPDWSKAKIFSGADKVLKGISKADYAIIRTCQNVAKNETFSLPLTVPVSAKTPLDLVIEGNGTVSQSGVNGCYYNGEEIDLIATPNGDDAFVGWFIDGTLVSQDRYYIVEKTDDLRITARFGGKTIENIEITALPKKITYFEGEEIDLNGLELTVNYTEAAPVMFMLRSAPAQTNDGMQSIAEQYTAYLTSNTAGKSYIVINYGGQTATVEIEILHDTIEYVQKEATCGEKGTLATYCTLCQAVIEEEDIPATGNHNYEWIVDAEPTCGDEGFKHEECSVCHGKRNENTSIPATGDHNYEWIVDTKPTCGDEGFKHEECSVCHGKRNENTSIPATGDHKYDDDFDTICNVCEDSRTVESISIESLPEKMVYLEAKDLLDLTGGKITVTYNDGVVFTVDMTADMISGFDNTVVGENTLSVTYGGKTCTFTVEIKAKTLTSIKVTTLPNKLAYVEGKDLDTTGMVVTAYYDNDTSKVVSDYKVEGYTSTPGIKTITVSFGGKTDSFEVEVSKKSLVSIKVTTKPEKLTYVEGKDLDTTGMVVTAYYDNDTSEVVTDYKVEGYTSTPGTKTITVTFEGKTDTFEVEVVEKTLTSIKVTTKPNKLQYIEGNAFDETGMVVTAYYDNDTSEVITDYKVEGYEATIGEKTITVSFGGKTDSFKVEVIAKTLLSIEVTKLPTKTEYLEGKDTLDLAGGEITLHYDNGTNPVISLSDAVVTGFDNTVVGENTLSVTYGEKTCTFKVEIKAKTLTSIKVTTLPNKLTYVEGKDLDTTGMVVTAYYDNDTSEVVTDYKVEGYTSTPGTKTITVTFEGKTDTFEVEVVEKTLTSIKVTTKPNKLSYIEGNAFDETGMVVTAYYDNDTSEVVSDYKVEGFESTIGEKTITVSFGGKTDSFKVEVIAKTLLSIEVTKLPTKTEYLEGKDPLDLAGGEITLHYDNGTNPVISLSDAVVTGFDNLTVGENLLTVTYGEKTCTFKVEIKAKTLTSIKVTTLPNKLTYVEGKDLDTTGMIVTAYYDNDTSEVVSDYKVEGYTSTPGTKTITVTYEGKTDTFEVEVVEKTLTSIKVTAKPNKLSYIEGNAFDATGMIVTAYYNNDTSEVVTDYKVEGYEATIGEKTITVSFGGKTDSFKVVVIEKSLSSIKVTTKPNKLQYIEGNAFDATGIIVTAYYDNGNESTVTGYTISGFESTPGKKIITVTFGDKTDTFEVEVIAKTLLSIEVTKLPTKTEYLEGKDTLDLTGGEITLHYDNGTNPVISLSDAVVTGFDNLTVGENLLTVTYGKKSCTFTVEIKAKSLVSIKVTTKPSKLTYVEGKDLDTTGMVVTAYYDNDTSEVVTDYTVEGYTSTPGTKTITVSFEGKTDAFEVEVVEKTLTSIKVTTKPNKLSYIEGNTFDETGMVVTAYYDNDTSEVVSDYKVEGFESTIGEKTITVSFGGKSDSFTVEVREKSVTSVEIKNLPQKLTYIEGTKLDDTGLNLNVSYDNGTSETLTAGWNSQYDFTTVGKTNVTVTFGGKSCSYEVEVIAKTLTSVEVTTLPNKLTYVVGKDFDKTGMVVTAFYDNGTNEVILDYKVEGFDSTPGTKMITVSYNGMSDSFTVEVVEKTLTSIKVTAKPNKLQYIEGNAFDETGMVVTAYYDNETSEVILDYKVEGFESTPGTKTVTVTYDGKSDSFTVEVREKSVTSIEVASLPGKLIYIEGTKLDDTGLSLTVFYDNGTSEIITTGWNSQYDFSTVGKASVSVTFSGKTCSYEVEVIAKTLTSIEVTAKPSKLAYVEGETFDIQGMVVTAFYDNGTEEVIGNYSVTGYTSTVGIKVITITYEGKTDTFVVSVIAKSMTSIAVTTLPNKTTYLDGDSLDLTGMVVTAYYNNNTSIVVYDYAVAGYDPAPGTKIITVNYAGMEASFTVTVNSRVPSAITSPQYNVGGGSISKITTGTTVSSLMSGIYESTFCRVYQGDNVVSGNTPIGTGMVVKIMDGETVKASYTVVVTGDTNGDGNTTVTDMIAIKAHVLKKSTLSGAYATAANTNGDSGISITDFIQVKAKILGKGDIIAR